MYWYTDELIRPRYTCWICIRWLNRNYEWKGESHEGIPYGIRCTTGDFLCRPMRTILMISWHTLKMRGNTRQEGTGWITFWSQLSWSSVSSGRERGKLALPTVVHWTYAIFDIELDKYVYCDPGPWTYGHRQNYYDITTHTRKDITKNRIFGNGRPNLHIWKLNIQLRTLYICLLWSWTMKIWVYTPYCSKPKSYWRKYDFR